MKHFRGYFFGKRHGKSREIFLDEVFLDSSNLPDFDVHQFEGRIEKPIQKKTIVYLGIFFSIVSVIFLWKIGTLQIVKGEAYALRSENNRLKHTPIFSERGIIYDRNGLELVWNSPSENIFPKRSYIDLGGFSHLLGYIGYPATDSSGVYYNTDFVGKDGVESYHDSRLQGANGLKIVETDALSKTRSESTVRTPVNGENLTLTIDARLQNKLFEFISNLSDSHGFGGGAGIIMDVETGGVLALTSFPEYSSTVLSEGDDRDMIRKFQRDKRTPFLNRVVSGLYTPGSTVKPFVALGALNENIINPSKEILSTGSISVDNPYFPDLKSVFTDWKAHGLVDMRDALAVSSNIYFYEIGGGYKDQKGIGISNIEKYTRMFGLGEVTDIDIPGEAVGVIPNPEWKAENFENDQWRLGDTYYTSIGQYGFLVTPLSLVRAISTIANKGILVSPHVVKNTNIESEKIEGIDSKNFDVVIEGMRQAVTAGTAKGLNIPQVKVAAKTGTAELGVSKKLVNSWIVGFFPYEKPRYAFTVVMEKGARDNTIGGLFVMRQLFEWMAVNTPEYLEVI